MGANREPDFSGYATKANIKCTDGRTITVDAFKDQDQTKVPLVWQHAHGDHTNVLGHAILENRSDGVYCYGYFNDTPSGDNARKIVAHGDVSSLSIYANRLVEKSKTVMHGIIREVSLVLAGANPGAFIDYVSVAHADGSYDDREDEAIISLDIPLEHTDLKEEAEMAFEHADDNDDNDGEKTVEQVFNTLSEEQKNVVYFMIGEALKSEAPGAKKAAVSHADGETVEETFDSLDDAQKDVVFYMIGEALKRASEDAAHADTENHMTSADADEKEGSSMAHNIFEKSATAQEKTLSHAEQGELLANARKNGVSSLKGLLENAAQEGTLAHGIDNIDILFPDAKSITTTPEWLSRRQEWVTDVMTNTRHTPFTRIRTLHANLTLPEARAKGYVKGNFKQEEFFPIIKRVTVPQTIYKKQKLDRDDILDITDFDVVAWLKAEMRLMLEEEIARAILIGDGRSAGDDDKIKEDNVRPIATDSDFFVTYVNVNLDDANSSPDEIIDALTTQRRHYRGSGNPTFYTSETVLAKLLLIKDSLGRRIYPTVAELTSALRASKIVTCEILDEPGNSVLGILVNLTDYNVGADRGGDVAMFEDFDIDYNQMKYLIETRISGALVKAKSALVVKKVTGTLVAPVAPTWNAGAHSVTVPNTTGVTYKNKLTGATLSNGTPIVLAEDGELTVQAVPASNSYYLAGTAEDEFLYTYDAGLVAYGF